MSCIQYNKQQGLDYIQSTILVLLYYYNLIRQLGRQKQASIFFERFNSESNSDSDSDSDSKTGKQSVFDNELDLDFTNLDIQLDFECNNLLDSNNTLLNSESDRDSGYNSSQQIVYQSTVLLPTNKDKAGFIYKEIAQFKKNGPTIVNYYKKIKTIIETRMVYQYK